MLPAARVPPPSRRPPNWSSEELGRGAHLKTPSSANHTAAASQPTGRIAKAASRLHLSRVSPRPYTRRKDPPTLIPRNQVSEGEGTRCIYGLPKEYFTRSGRQSWSWSAKQGKENNVCVYVFFTLTDRASTIPTNIKRKLLIIESYESVTYSSLYFLLHKNQIKYNPNGWSCSPSRSADHAMPSRPSEHPPVRGGK